MLVKFSTLNPSDQQQAASLLKAILKERKLDSCYRVETTRDRNLYIRPSQGNPPKSNERETFEILLVQLASSNIIAMSSRESRNLGMTINFIRKLNLDGLKKFLYPPVATPQDVDPILWELISPNIKKHWHDFNPSLQAHVIKCYQLKLVSQMEAFDDRSNFFDSQFRSPIGMEFPQIPVRLPIFSKDISGKEVIKPSNECYDLEELFAFTKLENPTTRQLFTLAQVMPDTAAMKHFLDKLNPQKSINNSEEKETDRYIDEEPEVPSQEQPVRARQQANSQPYQANRQQVGQGAALNKEAAQNPTMRLTAMMLSLKENFMRAYGFTLISKRTDELIALLTQIAQQQWQKNNQRKIFIAFEIASEIIAASSKGSLDRTTSSFHALKEYIDQKILSELNPTQEPISQSEKARLVLEDLAIPQSIKSQILYILNLHTVTIRFTGQNVETQAPQQLLGKDEQPYPGPERKAQVPYNPHPLFEQRRVRDQHLAHRNNRNLEQPQTSELRSQILSLKENFMRENRVQMLTSRTASLIKLLQDIAQQPSPGSQHSTRELYVAVKMVSDFIKNDPMFSKLKNNTSSTYFSLKRYLDQKLIKDLKQTQDPVSESEKVQFLHKISDSSLKVQFRQNMEKINPFRPN